MIVAPPWVRWALGTPRSIASVAGLGEWYEVQDTPAILVPATQPTIVNSDFSSWSGDNPAGWTVSESAPHVITESALGARFVTDGTYVACYQLALITGNRYRGDLVISAASAGALYLPTIGGASHSAVGSYSDYGDAASAASTVSRVGGMASDITVRSLGFTNLSRVRWNPRAGSYGGYLSNATATQQPWYRDGLLFASGDVIVTSLAKTYHDSAHTGAGGTIAAKVKPTDLSGYRVIASTSDIDFANTGVSVYGYTGGKIGIFVGNGSGSAAAYSGLSAAGVLSVGVTARIVARISAASVVVRVNGVDVLSGSLSSPSAGTSTRSMALGWGAANAWQGTIDRYAYWPRYLTDTEAAFVGAFT